MFILYDSTKNKLKKHFINWTIYFFNNLIVFKYRLEIKLKILLK